jgi:hypothetical protein
LSGSSKLERFIHKKRVEQVKKRHSEAKKSWLALSDEERRYNASLECLKLVQSSLLTDERFGGYFTVRERETDLQEPDADFLLTMKSPKLVLDGPINSVLVFEALVEVGTFVDVPILNSLVSFTVRRRDMIKPDLPPYNLNCRMSTSGEIELTDLYEQVEHAIGELFDENS